MDQMRQQEVNKFFFILLAIIIQSCQDYQIRKECLDEVIYFSVEKDKESKYDSIKKILYEGENIGSELYREGELNTISIDDYDKLYEYYKNYRGMGYLGVNLFTSKCYSCHEFYPHIKKELQLEDSFALSDLRRAMDEKHKDTIRLNEIEVRAIHEYIRPKQIKALP